MQLVDSITYIVGGLVFFIYGLQVITGAFERLSGAYLRVALNLLARNRFGGLLVGTVLSFLFASTSGATVLLVGMGNAGIIGLRQALAVVLGAAIGTTLIVQLIAFDIGGQGIYLVAFGFLLRTFARYERSRDTGLAIFGAGLLFFGLSMMRWGVEASVASQSLQGLRAFLVNMSANPFYLFLLGIAATALFQSSATTLAIVFAFSPPLTAAAGIPIAIGASVGTTAAGLVSGIASKPIGRQIAIAHLLMKLLAASFFMMMLPQFTQAVELWSRRLDVLSPQRIVANANTLYNLLGALIFLPLLPVVEGLVTSFTRKWGQPSIEGMSIEDLDDPPGAIEKARLSVVRMGRVALDMLRRDLSAFLVNAHRVTDEMLDSEKDLDTYDAILSDYLARVDQRKLTPAQGTMRTRLLYIAKDIEHVGDVLAMDLVPLARKKARKGLEFSIEGAQQFDRFHRLVADDFAEAIDLLEGLPANVERVAANATRIDDLRRDIVESHIRRISQGVTADAETTRILLDAVASLRSIHYYAHDIVKIIKS